MSQSFFVIVIVLIILIFITEVTDTDPCEPMISMEWVGVVGQGGG